jgi:hypothetical protein
LLETIIFFSVFRFVAKFVKPKKIDFTPRLKMKGKSKTGRKEARKKAVKVAGLKVTFLNLTRFYF